MSSARIGERVHRPGAVARASSSTRRRARVEVVGSSSSSGSGSLLEERCSRLGARARRATRSRRRAARARRSARRRAALGVGLELVVGLGLGLRLGGMRSSARRARVIGDRRPRRLIGVGSTSARSARRLGSSASSSPSGAGAVLARRRRGRHLGRGERGAQRRALAQRLGPHRRDGLVDWGRGQRRGRRAAARSGSARWTPRRTRAPGCASGAGANAGPAAATGVRVPQKMQYFQAGCSARAQFTQAVMQGDYRVTVTPTPPRTLVIGHRAPAATGPSTPARPTNWRSRSGPTPSNPTSWPRKTVFWCCGTRTRSRARPMSPPIRSSRTAAPRSASTACP